jgi:hypothetical protein
LGLNLAAQETRDPGKVQLVIGSQAEEVSFTAVATPVQTASSEKSSLVDGSQLNQIAIKGRDMMAMMNLIPGVYSVSVTATFQLPTSFRVRTDGD